MGVYNELERVRWLPRAFTVLRKSGQFRRDADGTEDKLGLHDCPGNEWVSGFVGTQFVPCAMQEADRDRQPRLLEAPSQRAASLLPRQIELWVEGRKLAPPLSWAIGLVR